MPSYKTDEQSKLTIQSAYSMFSIVWPNHRYGIVVHGAKAVPWSTLSRNDQMKW